MGTGQSMFGRIGMIPMVFGFLMAPLWADVILNIKAKFEHLKPEQQQLAAKLGYQPGDLVELRIYPAGQSGGAKVSILPKGGGAAHIVPASPTALATTAQRRPPENPLVIRARYSTEFQAMRKMGMGVTVKLSVAGKTVQAVVGELLAFGTYLGYARFDDLPEKIRDEASRMGYRSDDMVGIRATGNTAVLLPQSVTLSAEQVALLNGMVVEGGGLLKTGDGLGTITELTREKQADGSQDWVFTLTSRDGKEKNTFPGYRLLGLKLRPDLKAPPATAP